jgi:hypothetical protein
MSTVLRAYGADFDVEAFLVGCTLPVCAIKRLDEPVFPKSQPQGRRHERSGVHVTVSDADFDNLPAQIADTIKFLRSNTQQLERLAQWPGIESMSPDFAINRRDVAVQCDTLPSELLRLGGMLGFDIELSQYPAKHTF